MPPPRSSLRGSPTQVRSFHRNGTDCTASLHGRMVAEVMGLSLLIVDRYGKGEGRARILCETTPNPDPALRLLPSPLAHRPRSQVPELQEESGAGSPTPPIRSRARQATPRDKVWTPPLPVALSTAFPTDPPTRGDLLRWPEPVLAGKRLLTEPPPSYGILANLLIQWGVDGVGRGPRGRKNQLLAGS